MPPELIDALWADWEDAEQLLFDASAKTYDNPEQRRRAIADAHNEVIRRRALAVQMSTTQGPLGEA